MLTRSGKVVETDSLPSVPTSDAVPKPSPSTTRPVTRTATDFWLIGHPSASITGARLPDGRQVLKYFLYLRHDEENVRNSLTNQEIAYAVTDTVVTSWNMARIKTKNIQNCMLDFWRCGMNGTAC